MAEYIEREAIAKLFDSECCGECAVCPHDDYGDCTLINQIPSADVQPVVRCINCKYYEGLACCKLIGDCGGTNWFCGWGEPKGET